MVVPIDITAEEKEVLAILSKRQFMILVPAFLVSFGFVVFIPLPFLPTGIVITMKILFPLITMISACLLAFVHLDKYEQSFSDFLVTQYKFKRSQKVFYYW
ncbi:MULTISPECIES: PrgI family protein [Alkalihalophilus]|uniref:PrgI family protein n=1 Tax=Alkalihalophilus TaxID=2893060 RepID=UPI001EE3F72A|nr:MULTISPECIES: PrgI family protein [Alkalihalophilus]MEC2074229.1 PrgI family protein [Alkalihalophilus marmarensis]